MTTACEIDALADPSRAQLFLGARKKIDQLVGSAGIRVVELGAGIGTLARHLPRCRQLTLVEMDSRLLPYLERKVRREGGIAEDEACGSGAMRMAAAFGRRLTLHHGKGSVLVARPGPAGHADVTAACARRAEPGGIAGLSLYPAVKPTQSGRLAWGV